MTRTRPLPSHSAMVAAIMRTYQDATAAQRAAGCDWYPTAGRIASAIADATGQDVRRIAYALAALSPRNPWRWNVADAYAYAHACATAPDGPIPAATTFLANRRAAWDALRADGDPWAAAAPKVRAFVAAILGDRSAVVVDVWAARVATDGDRDRVTPAEYAIVAAAYTDAALRLGADARDVQAVTWLVAQSRGLGSRRRARHDVSYKRSTAPVAIEIMRRNGL